VLAFGDRGGIHRVVEIVRCGIVNDLNIRIVQQRFVARVGLARADGFCFFVR
jgi:hypothetical protein